MPAEPKFKVQVCSGSEELRQIAHLRYEVYVGELKRNNYSYVDNVNQLLQDPNDTVDGVVNIFVKLPNETMSERDSLPMKVVGCARIHVPVPHHYCDMFGLEDATLWTKDLVANQRNFAFFSRFMVHADYRKYRSISAELLRVSAEEAWQAGARLLLLNCTPALVSYYERSACVRYSPVVWENNMGLQVPMVVVLDDIPFMTKLALTSPMLPALKQLAEANPAPKSPTVKWLAEVQKRRMPLLFNGIAEPENGVYLEACKHINFSKLPLFEGLSEDQISEILGKKFGFACLLDVRKGVQIMRAGDVRDEAFIILEGSLSLPEFNMTMNAGSVLGEVAFMSGVKRTADVFVGAERDTLLVGLSRMGFMKVMKACPVPAVQVLWNLSQLTANRHSENTDRFKHEIETLKGKMKALSRGDSESTIVVPQVVSEPEHKRVGKLLEKQLTKLGIKRMSSDSESSLEMAKGNTPPTNKYQSSPTNSKATDKKKNSSTSFACVVQ